MERAQENLFLLTNGLGGYASATAAFSLTRCDQGMLVAARIAPNDRMTLVGRLSEKLTILGREHVLSTQQFADGSQSEEGYRFLSSFVYENWPQWVYHAEGVQVTRAVVMAYGSNASAVIYTIENRTSSPCAMDVTPFMMFTTKSEALLKKKTFALQENRVTCGAHTLYLSTNGYLYPVKAKWEMLAYPDDAKDGRPKQGLTGACCAVRRTVAPGETAKLKIVFSAEELAPSAEEMMQAMRVRRRQLVQECGIADEVARQLAVSADAFIARRDSTGGQTILAGYPFFGDWGRDTMIALPGCTLTTGRYDAALSILRTFLAYEKDGLVPNLFPEGTQQPMYNTVDAALLLINCIWLYYQKTGNMAFVREAWPVLVRIIDAYCRGTKHGIGMDEDGLIHAGEGLDQVTWMDVCVEGILPTPRHGKPVEINAYWYNALRIMEALAPVAGEEGMAYGRLADTVRASFVKAFYMPELGYLKDVVSGTPADTQLRCNQIWAVTMPFTMLSPDQEYQVVDAVYQHLYTPCGLRTLAPEDEQFHPVYQGEQKQRDMAYHQGTAWVFPLGAYYLAYLKTRGYSDEAARVVREQLEPMEAALREGCIGQLPEIYDGMTPAQSKGCFAQAWSVGEMLRVYEALCAIEQGKDEQ